MVTYTNKIGEVPVGELYESIELDDGTTIETNETVVGWDEPDIDERTTHNGHQVTSMVTTGIVDKIYKRPSGPEISIKNAPLGRLSVESHNLKVPAKRPDRYLGSNANGCVIEFWYNGEYDIEEK